MSIFDALFALLVFPGLLYAAPMGWLTLWIERKLAARMQGRIGPPFGQPFWDFAKLLAKRPIVRSGADAPLFTALPVVAVASTLGALALLPALSSDRGFAGDVVLLVGLLEMPAILIVLAGFASRSIFGQLGATREAMLSLTYSLPFLGGIVALAAAAGSLRLSDLALLPPAWVRVPAVVALLLCLPVKLRLNPFSVANAEQEIYAGPLTEYDGPRLALWELAHAFEFVALSGLVAALVLPVRTGSSLLDAVVFAALSIIVVAGLAIVSAATARLKLAQASRFYWRWGLGLTVVSLVAAALPLGRLFS